MLSFTMSNLVCHEIMHNEHRSRIELTTLSKMVHQDTLVDHYIMVDVFLIFTNLETSQNDIRIIENILCFANIPRREVKPAFKIYI